MIQTKIQSNLTNAKPYFREHLGAGDYYSEGQKITRAWLGAGAEKLGVKGAVGKGAFIALGEGEHPETGLRLGQRLNSVRNEGGDAKANRRIFFDFTIAPPKSVRSSGSSIHAEREHAFPVLEPDDRDGWLIHCLGHSEHEPEPKATRHVVELVIFPVVRGHALGF